MQILFVDDEPNILTGIKRMMRPMRKTWKMYFAQSGQEALDLLTDNQVDIIVSDMRMPEMEGGDLLSEVQKKYPWIVRIILSGHTDYESTIKTIRPAHKFLSKPCPQEILTAAIKHLDLLKRLLPDQSLRLAVTGIDTLPARPMTYATLVQNLFHKNGAQLDDAISHDAAMSANILKLVVNAFLGPSQRLPTLQEAPSLLGEEIFKKLVVAERIFCTYQDMDLHAFSLDTLWQHTHRTACFAQTIVELEGGSPKAANDAFWAGLLHDIGKLVLISLFPKRYQNVVNIAHGQNLLLSETEKNEFAATHAEVGGYLLGLWGLPLNVVEAITFHHLPSQMNKNEFSVLTAVHVANILDHHLLILDKKRSIPKPDSAHLAKLGLQSHVKTWAKSCKKIISNFAPDEQDRIC